MLQRLPKHLRTLVAAPPKERPDSDPILCGWTRYYWHNVADLQCSNSSGCSLHRKFLAVWISGQEYRGIDLPKILTMEYDIGDLGEPNLIPLLLECRGPVAWAIIISRAAGWHHQTFLDKLRQLVTKEQFLEWVDQCFNTAWCSVGLLMLIWPDWEADHPGEIWPSQACSCKMCEDRIDELGAIVDQAVYGLDEPQSIELLEWLDSRIRWDDVTIDTGMESRDMFVGRLRVMKWIIDHHPNCVDWNEVRSYNSPGGNSAELDALLERVLDH